MSASVDEPATAAATAERWARGKGFIALLATLSPTYDHILQGKAKEVTPMSSEDAEVKRAYRQAMMVLHPDRMAQRGVEQSEDAAEVLKVLNEAHDRGEMPQSMLLGEITLLYKKKDPRDVRNYRPITLLNVDYKILTKVLGERIKVTLDSIISAPQTGFVPKRQIAENTHLMRLIQAYLDETNEEGLMCLLDCEKAFDRCSWEYLRKAMKALGYGGRMCEWVRLLYDYDVPPRRRLKINGEKGPLFPLQSGVAQGCPLSALLFLFVTEGLSRMICILTREPNSHACQAARRNLDEK